MKFSSKSRQHHPFPSANKQPRIQNRIQGFPLVNGRGFAIIALTDAGLRKLIADYNASDEDTLPELFGKWLCFETYRQIYISGAYI